MPEIRDIWLLAHNMIRSARKIINEGLKPLNLSSAEGNILLHLFTQGDEMGQDQLVGQLDISKPAVSRVLNSLKTKGFITWQQDPHDRRAHRVHLTRKAREIGPAVENIYNHVYRLALQGITQEELGGFINLFNRMSENFAIIKTGNQGNNQDAAE